MKIIFALTSLYLLAVSQFCRADTLAVFAKDHFTVVTPIGYASGATDERARTNFIKALAQHERAAVTYEQRLPIINPPDWGRTVKGSSGTLGFESKFEQGLVIQITLAGLLPSHLYKLCLNGTPGHPGNELLLDAVPGMPNERYYDFLTVSTDERGDYQANLGVYLLPGKYHTRVYVKDATDSKIVLYRDFFDFDVLSEPTK